MIADMVRDFLPKRAPANVVRIEKQEERHPVDWKMGGLVY